VSRANALGLDVLFLAAATFPNGSINSDKDLVGGLDPLTWQPSAERSDLSSVSISTGRVLTRLKVGSMFFNFCDRVTLVDIEASGGIGSTCGLTLVGYRRSSSFLQFDFWPATATYVISSSTLDDVTFGPASTVTIDRSRVRNVNAGAGSTVSITNSRLAAVVGSGTLPVVVVAHSGIVPVTTPIFGNVDARLVNSWVQVPTNVSGDLVSTFIPFRTQQVAWTASGASATVQGAAVTAFGIATLNNGVEHTGNIFVTDVLDFDGLHVLPTSPVLDLGVVTDAGITSISAGDIDGECRGSSGSPDLGADEVP
jgi:hypothetical protein